MKSCEKVEATTRTGTGGLHSGVKVASEVTSDLPKPSYKK